MKIITTVIIIAVYIVSFGGELMADKNSIFYEIKDVAPEEWRCLADKRILFGHQSVGNNLITGLNELMKEYHFILLNIKETTIPDDFSQGIFAHFAVGKNNSAESKINDFDIKIRQGLGIKSDVAFFKFCFVDIDDRTNVENIFKKYTGTMAALKKDYPNIKFVHFTVPLLKKDKTTIKSFIKGIFGKSDGFFANSHNVRRNEYNQLLLKEYSGKEPIFDLATISSTHEDGTRESFSVNGMRYYALCPEYTEDGGHLNAIGRKLAAKQLLIFLAQLD